MIKKECKEAYLMLNESTPTIRTGNFSYQPSRNIFLTDVVVESGDGFHRIYGKKREFEWHQYDCDFSYDFVKHGMLQYYCIDDSDWYDYEPGFIARLFGKKPCKMLESNWYMHKSKMKDACYTIYGGLIEEHY